MMDLEIGKQASKLAQRVVNELRASGCDEVHFNEYAIRFIELPYYDGYPARWDVQLSKFENKKWVYLFRTSSINYKAACHEFVDAVALAFENTKS
jgi:hypothetical protein